MARDNLAPYQTSNGWRIGITWQNAGQAHGSRSCSMLHGSSMRRNLRGATTEPLHAASRIHVPTSVHPSGLGSEWLRPSHQVTNILVLLLSQVPLHQAKYRITQGSSLSLTCIVYLSLRLCSYCIRCLDVQELCGDKHCVNTSSCSRHVSI